MAYTEMNIDNIPEYVKSVTDFFAPDANLDVYQFGEGEDDGDGYINFLFRVSDENGKSLILKQARKNPRNPSVQGLPLVGSRNLTEAETMLIKSAIIPEYIPEIYYIDKENNLYLCEDCGDLKIMRFELIKGKRFPKFARQIGEYLAKTNFYTSEIYMDPVEHRKLQEHFMNPVMRQIFEVLLFLDMSFSERTPEESPTFSPERLEMGERLWKDKDIQTELLKLRHLHMKKSECLVHGDLHTSNILIDQDDMKIIDQEYTYMGLASCDTGYLIGNLVYQIVRWFFDETVPEEKRVELSQTALKYIEDLLETYQEVYKECWEADAKDMYRDYDGYRESLMKQFIREVTGAIGAQIASRVGRMSNLPDFDSITDEEKRNQACEVSLLMAREFLLHWEEIDTIEALIKLIEDSLTAALYIVMNKH